MIPAKASGTLTFLRSNVRFVGVADSSAIANLVCIRLEKLSLQFALCFKEFGSQADELI